MLLACRQVRRTGSSGWCLALFRGRREDQGVFQIMMDGVRALIFDVFGTLVDWRTSVAKGCDAILRPQGVSIDAVALAHAWRAQYQAAMQEVRSGRLAFCPLDVLHRRNLDLALDTLGLSHQVPGPTRDALNRVWHRLDAWPDVGARLRQWRESYLLAPCSNGNISLMVDLARHNGWHWDAILGAEIARDYKPQPVVYQSACRALDLLPEQVMMVAAHSDDLQAAARCGLRTAFWPRPDEFGPQGGAQTQPGIPVDVVLPA